jgi:hypothetical protein
MRFLKWLGVLVVLLAVGGWFGAKFAIEKGVSAWFADMAAKGMTAEKSAASVGGFPARLDLQLADVKLADPVGGAGWQAPSLRVFATTWAPWHLTAELPGQQVITLPGQTVTATSDGLVATFGSAPDMSAPLREVTLRGATLTATSDLGWTLGADDFFVTLLADDSRPAGAYLLEFDLAPLRPDPAFLAALAAVSLPDLPAPDFPPQIDTITGKIGLIYSAPLNLNAAESPPLLDRVKITGADVVWGQLALSAKGELVADAGGFAAGQVQLKLTNWDRLPALLVAAGAVKPAIAPTVGNFLKAMAADGADPAVLDLVLEMRDGRMSLGPFPLGEAPRMRSPQS